MCNLVEGCLYRMLSKRVNRDLSAFGVALAVAVNVGELNFLYTQRLQCACSVPLWNGRRNVRFAIRLRQHEPIAAKHEALQRDLGLNLTIRPFLFYRALHRDRHAQLNCFLPSLDVPSKLFPTIEAR